MNLHPVTLLFILILAAFFYSQGQLFFLMATLVVGFLLLFSSISSPSASHGHGHGESGSVYPDKMSIEVKGHEDPPAGGEEDFAKRVGGSIDFFGNLAGSVVKGIPKTKEDKNKGGH